jgi:hypothetical protein
LRVPAIEAIGEISLVENHGDESPGVLHYLRLKYLRDARNFSALQPTCLPIINSDSFQLDELTIPVVAGLHHFVQQV